MRILLLFLLLSAGALAQELLQNGRLREFPDPATLKTEDHAGALVVLLPAGSDAVPGWKVLRPVQVSLWKGRGSRSWNFKGTGGISQKLSVTPGKRYRLAVVANQDAEGPPKQKFAARVGNQSREFEALGDTSEWIFSPEQASVTLELSGRNPNRGPFVWSISVTEYNPELEAVRSEIGRVYRALDNGVRRNGDLAKVFAALAPDFSFKPATGDPLDAAHFQEFLTRMAGRKPDLSSGLDQIKITPTGAELTVERTTRGYDDGGRPTTDKSTFKDVWVKSAAGWKWQSSEELAPTD